MKKTIFYVCFAFFPLLLQLYSCSEDEAPPIDLTTISKEYQEDALKIFFNGVEYSREGEVVALVLPSMIGVDSSDEIWQGKGEKMLLEILPFWPEINNDNQWNSVIFEVDAISTPDEVRFTGSYSDAPDYYLLKVEGIVRDEVMTIHLTYTEQVNRITGNTYVFRFDESSLDFMRLYPKYPTVEFDGQQIPTEDFIRDALTPVLEVIRESLHGDLQVEFLPDGSTNVSVLSTDEGSATIIPGWHGYRIHSNQYGFLCSDYEGASWFSKRLVDRDEPYVGGLYTMWIDTLYFFGVYYDMNDDSDLLLALEDLYWNDLHTFLYSWQTHIGDKTLSETELEKVERVITMISRDEIDMVLIRGEKIN